MQGLIQQPLKFSFIFCYPKELIFSEVHVTAEYGLFLVTTITSAVIQLLLTQIVTESQSMHVGEVSQYFTVADSGYLSLTLFSFPFSCCL